MGTNQFQREYIEYLQERNTELLNKLNHLKENYENKIIGKDLNKHYLISALEDVLNVCTAIPQEIDLFFDKMTAAMGAFKNILLRKSEMVQLVEKISKIINPAENISNDLITMEDSGLVKDEISEAKAAKKAGAVKVYPMINGHVISTEPRIYLSRVPEEFTPGRKSGPHQLSPIIEASPETPSDSSKLRNYVFREIKIPLERINLNKMSYNYINEESPKSRFKGPKTWKKSLSSNFQQSDQKNSLFPENHENFTKKHSVGENELPHLTENIDPLEGPSWLHEEISELNSSSSRFIDYRRRKHRFATVFDKNEDCVSSFDESKKSFGEELNELYENQEDKDDENNLEKSEKKVSESSEDFISESFVSEGEDSISSKRRKRRSNRRVHTEEPNCVEPNDAEFVEDPSNKISVAHLKNKTSAQSGTSDCENDEEFSAQESKDHTKRFLRLSFNKKSMGLSFEKTPNRAEHTEEINGLNKRSRSKGKEEESTKNALKNGDTVKLENFKSNEELIPKKETSRSPSVKKKSEKNRSKTKSKSPVVVLPEYEGRKKRKAAPSFKLVEPKLSTKLRRA